MKNPPLVTIGLTCFNCEKTIERALISAINQEWKNKEIILIDDYSTDDSKNVLSKLKSQYPQINIIFNNENKGLAFNENLIIEKSNGEFLVYFDGDDESQTNRITKQYQRFQEYKSKYPESKFFVFSNRNVNSIEGVSKKFVNYGIGRKSPEPFGLVVAHHLLKIKKESDKFCWGLLGSGTMFTKVSYLKNLNGFDKEFKRGAEIDLWIRAAMKGYHFISVNESLMTQYITYGSHKTLKKDFLSRKQLIKKHKKYLIQNHSYMSSIFNFYAWYWYTKKVRIIGHFFRLFARFFMLIRKSRI